MDTSAVTVCVCTYKRQELLRRVLLSVLNQVTDDRFTISIVVVDNDREESGKGVVGRFIELGATPIEYFVEPQQNIALARNMAVQNAAGEYIAFLDDDEVPVDNWLLNLFMACQGDEIDGVVGSAKPHFDGNPPRWVVKGRFYERATFETGYEIDWRKGRTGNLLLKRHVLASLTPPFRSDFHTGEDHDFFRRAIAKGFRFVWCHEALTQEIIPKVRWKRSFMLRRALLRGKISLRHPNWRLREVLKSIAAVTLYALALPLLVLFGQHLFMRYLIRIFDHLGVLITWVGLDPIRETYVTE